VTERRRDSRELKTRSQWRAEITTLCARLNAAGCDPQWTPRLLREHVNAKFEVLLGLDALSFDQLRRTRDDLKHRLEALEAGARQQSAA
jgi:hypothetical protein